MRTVTCRVQTRPVANHSEFLDSLSQSLNEVDCVQDRRHGQEVPGTSFHCAQEVSRTRELLLSQAKATVLPRLSRQGE